MKILVVTVGGSLTPIVRAWQRLQPDFTYFVCSSDDRVTNAKGSYTQIEPVKATGSASLTEELGISADQWSTLLVESDDLVGAYNTLADLFGRLRTQSPDALILADYTGGTKSMSAALVLAGSQFDFVRLNVITGARQNLIKVADGTESMKPVNLSSVRADWNVNLGLSHWHWYGYSAAEATLLPVLDWLDTGDFRNRVSRAVGLSKAFGCWDRFQYKEALNGLSVFERGMSPALRDYHIALKELVHDNPTDTQRFLGLWDLWLNCQRRAEQSRFDDAVARCYRLVEASGQWVLSFYKIDTAHVDLGQLSPRLAKSLNLELTGVVEFGLFQTWQLAIDRHSGPLATTMREEYGLWRNLIGIRNHSYLGHGFHPISPADWSQWQRWLEQSFVPALVDEAKAHGIRRLPGQLPKSFVDLDFNEPRKPGLH